MPCDLITVTDVASRAGLSDSSLKNLDYIF